MKKLLLTILLFCATVITALAQTSTGRLTGVVSTADGVLPGATVTATDNTTGKIQTVTTKEDGAFSFPQLEAGTFTVNITANGFKTFVANELKIDVGREYNLNPVLEIGDVQESVTITAGADVVTATSAQISNTVSPQQILSLPLLTRNPLALTNLQAGTQSNPFQQTTINGVRTSFTNITRDGINIQDAFIRTNATDFAPGRPSVDDTAEFTVITSNQEADQGYGSAQIRLVTPRGGKDFNGALFAYNRNSYFGANNFFNNRTGSFVATDRAVIDGRARVGDKRNPRPFRNRNQFGGKIGGPLPLPSFGEGGPTVLRDKGFFFFNYEKIIDPISTPLTTPRTILTPTARAGQFRYNRTIAGNPIDTGGVSCPSGAANSVCTITDFLAFARAQNLPFTSGANGVPIPTTIDPIIQARVLNLLPANGNVTNVGDGLNTTGFLLNRRSDQERSTYTGRIDIDIDDNNTINGVYSYNFETNLRPDVDATGFSEVPTGEQTSANKTLSLAYRRTFTPNFVNEVRGGLFYSDVPFFRTVDTPGYFLALPLGVSNPDNTFLNQGRNVKTFNLQDNADYILGKHSLRFGGQLQFFQVDSNNFVNTLPTVNIGTNTASTPAFQQTNFANFGGINATQAGTANGLLALLGGISSGVSQNFNVADLNTGFQPGLPLLLPFRYANHALYIADRYQINNQLTINAGVRYELFPALRLENGLALEPVITNPDDPIASLLNPNGTFNVIGTNSGTENTYYKTDYNNFAPSVGLAYAPKFENGVGKFLLGDTFVIRAGFSRAYGNDNLVTGINNANNNNVGFGARQGIATTATGSGFLNLRIGQGIPAITTPTFANPPLSFARNNTTGISATQNFGTVFGVDPKVQTPSVDQYSIGFQRELFGNTALEIRYVGTRSTNLLRGVDLNQVDIFRNGFVDDFNRASRNFALTGNAFCTAAQNAGCQGLTILTPTGAGVTPGSGRLLVGAAGANGAFAGGLPVATLVSNIQGGTPAELAFQFITQGFNNSPNLTNPTATPFVRFVANPSTGAVNYVFNDASFNYNSLQVEVRRRFSQGLYFQANYTFSKNLTNAIGSLNSPASGQSLFEPYLDNNNQRLDFTRSDSDQTHTFNVNSVYQFPFGKGRAFLNQGGIVDKLVGGFELSTILQYGTGAPITFTDTRGTLNRAARSTRQTPSSTLTNDQIRDLAGVFEANGNIYFINPSIINPTNGQASNGYVSTGPGTLNNNTTFNGQAFFNVAPGQTGNTARFLIDGPSNFNFNAALLKNISLTERSRVQLRAEAFNLFNTVNFFNNTQLANINSATFGQVTSAGAARQFQFAARFEF